MQLRSIATLPALEVPAQLTLKLAPPDGHLAHVTVEMDGRQVGRFTCADITTQTWLVPANGKTPRQLVITSDAAVNPGKLGVNGDTRDLALRLEAIGWVPAARR